MILVNHIWPAFGDRKLREIRKAEIETWLAGLPLANQSKNHVLYALKVIMREAEDAGIIERDPTAKTRIFGRNYAARDVFTIEEIGKLFPPDPVELRRIHRSDDSAVMLMVLASTEIRAGEWRALQWRDVLWDRQALIIERSIKSQSSEWEIGPVSQQKGGERLVLLPSRTLDALRSWREKTFASGDKDWIFPGRVAGMPIHGTAVNDRLHSAMKRAAIEANGRNLVAHSLRHTYNTIMRRRLPEDTLHALTGHSSRAMSERYDHPQLTDRLRAIEGARRAVEGLLPE